VTDYTVLWIVLGVLLLGGVASALVVPRLRRRSDDDVPPQVDGAPGPATDVLEPETGAPTTVAEPDALTAPPVETPEPAAGRMVRLRDRLARSGSPLGARLLALLSRDDLTEDVWDEIEETLLLADLGAGPAEELLEALRTRVRVLGVREPAAVRALLREELVKVVDPTMDRALRL
jgi:fused signal recognition particle receptor